VSWEWWHLPTIPPLTKLKQEHHKYEPSLGYIARLLFQSWGRQRETERVREMERMMTGESTYWDRIFANHISE
jgi:hypothetical protein